MLFTMEINRKFFEKRIIKFIDEMEPDLVDLFRDVNGVVPFSYKASLNYQNGQMIDQFRHCNLLGITRKLYLESKAYEIFASFLTQYSDDSRLPGERKLFRQNHIKAIKNTAEYIRLNLDSAVNIPILLELTSISSKVLQDGFRNIYGMSVNEFIQNERLIEIKKLLGDTNLSITEIVYTVGLSSNSYLSKIFMERYNFTPSNYRSRNNRANI